jgi:hypothetical protein
MPNGIVKGGSKRLCRCGGNEIVKLADLGTDHGSTRDVWSWVDIGEKGVSGFSLYGMVDGLQNMNRLDRYSNASLITSTKRPDTSWQKPCPQQLQ